MARANRPDASPHVEALSGIWSWALAPSPSAALRRRIFLWLLIIGFVGLLIVFRPQGIQVWQALITPANLGHILVVCLAFWLALTAATAVLHALFPVASLADARRHILRRALGGGYGTLNMPETENSSLAYSGGPGWVRINLEHAAVTERADGSLRVLTPGQRPVLLDGFERVRSILHLKEQVLTLNLWARSRDGIRVRVEGARLVFGLARSKREPTLQQPYPFDPNAAMDLVYAQRVEKTTQRLRGQQREDLVAEQGQAFFERQLQEFIGQFTFGELLTASESRVEALAGFLERSGVFSGKLLLARDKLRDAFIARVQNSAAAIGLQVNWLDIGTWKLDERARAALAGKQDTSSAYLSLQTDEFNDLVEQLLPDNLRPLEEEWINEALTNFTSLFTDLREKYQELKSESEPQLESVIRFLNLLTKQHNPKKS